MQTLSIIVAYAQHRVIGLDNQLPWHLPEDLKRFKALTMGHHIIMGRKTYESLGRLLPGRTTVIVTRNRDFQVAGALIAHSLSDAIALCKNADGQADEEVFLIGGAELYQSAMQIAHKLYVTEVDLAVQGDAYFSDIESNIWQEVAREKHASVTGLAFEYVTYLRKKPV